MRYPLRGASILLLWTAMLAMAYLMITYGRFGMTDFRVYYGAARMLLDGVPPYIVDSQMFYLYPPLLAQIFMPLAAIFSFEQTALIWTVANLLFILGTAGLLSRFTPPKDRWAIWLLPPLFSGFIEALVMGQVTIVLLAIFAAAWAARKTDRPYLAGALLAFAAWLKLYPALILLYFLWKRDWRVVIGAAAAGVFLLIAQVLISGIEMMESMLPVVFTLSAEGQPHLLVDNSSVFGFTSQLFAPSEFVQPLIASPTLTLISRILLTVGLLAVLLYSTHLGKPSSDSRFDFEYALSMLTALLLSPTLWVSGMPPLALIYYLLWRNRPGGAYGRWIAWFCLFAPLGLTVYFVFILGYSPHPPQSGLLVAFGFYILILTWLLIVARLNLRPQNRFRAAA